MHLTTEERRRVDECVAAFEAATGAQVVTAVAAKSDNYPEIPWKAFALGASLAALARVIVELARPDWHTGYATLIDAVAILGAGAALALLSIRVHGLARLFLPGARAEAEARQHARDLFLRHEIFGTPARTGVMILVSLFERRVVILPDIGFQAELGEHGLEPVVAGMLPLLAAGRTADALCHGVTAVGALLAARGLHADGNEGAGLPNAVLEEDGDHARR